MDNIKKVCEDQNNNAFLASLLCTITSNWHFEVKSRNSKTVAQVVLTLDISLKKMAKYTLSSEVGGKTKYLIIPMYIV